MKIVQFPKAQPPGQLGNRQLLWLRGNILEFKEMQDRAIAAGRGGIEPQRGSVELPTPTDGEKT